MKALFLSLASTAFAMQRPAAVPVVAVQAEMRLGMRKSGELTSFGPDHEPNTKSVFILVVGDPGAEDQRYRLRTESGIPPAFQLDSAQYFHNEDATWRLYNFRMPNMGEGEENETRRFLDYLGTDEAQALMKDPWARQNHGTPRDFIYKKMRVLREELPPPLNRASDETLKDIVGIFRYNADGTMKLFLRPPLDQDGEAQKVYWKLRSEIERL